MKLPELGVKRPVTSIVVFVAILVVGIYSLANLALDLMPDISFPSMSIVTTYPGASAEDVESRVTKVIENSVATVPNIDEVSSVSKENVSAITLKFNWGTNLAEAANDVRDNLDMITPYLPDDANKPMIFKFSMSMIPVMFLGVQADQSYDNLWDIVDKQIVDPLKRVPGVGTAFAFGGKQRQINIILDRTRLEAYNISLDQITSLLKANNLNMPGGPIAIGRKEYQLRVPGEFKNLEQIRDLVVGATKYGIPIHLKDLAEVENGFKEETWNVRVNKKHGIMIWVQKQSGANTVEVSKAIQKKLKEIQPLLPSDVKMRIIMDSSVFINRSISQLTSTILWGGLLVFLVVLLFLQNIKGSIIVALTIPFSLIIAFLFLYLAGYTINIMSLSSLAIAIGMVVDNGIVVFENIFRHRYQLHREAEEAAIFGSSEIGNAISASTLTTIAIFLPIIFIHGIIGVLFKELGWVIIIVLLASLFAALFFTPMLASLGLKEPRLKKPKTRLFRFISDQIGAGFEWLTQTYTKLLSWAFDHKGKTILYGLLIFIVSLSLLKFIPTEFMPEMDQGQIEGIVETPAGTKLSVLEGIMKQVEGIVFKDVPERQNVLVRSGASPFSGVALAMGQKEGQNYGRLIIQLKPKKQRHRSDKEIAHFLAGRIRKIPGVSDVDFSQQDPFAQMFSGGKPVSIEIYGYNLALTDSLARLILKKMQTIPGITNAEISRQSGQPELWIQVDRAKAAALGLNMASIATAIRTQVFGSTASLYRKGGNEYDIYVRLREQDRVGLNDLSALPVMSVTGKQIPLSNFASIIEERGPVELDRKNQSRVVTVSSNIYGRKLGQVTTDLKKQLATITVPPGVEIKFAGSIEQQRKSFQTLGWALIVGFLLVYLVMAAQFESFIDPFIIMFSVPFAIIGVLWALFLTGLSLNVNSLFGMVMLTGIVVNNAIVLIDYVNILRGRGKALRTAILEAGRTRLRPVLMTAFTTIFGLLPMALSRGEGSETWVPLAVAVIGGLLVSTLITLVFVPTLYAVVESKLRGKRTFHRLEEI
ncbi:MAG: efflux RND transporter permease subunit [Calditrichaeota bacterium]|nr:efflux RND transporter permease subunit [Calditrichota bacterium]